MKGKRTGLALALLGAAAVAAWAGGFDPAYEAELLKRPLGSADKSFCDQKAGANQGASAYNACQVTRNYLSDINAKKEKGFPPSADTAYTRNSSEESLLVDRLPPG